MFKVGQRVICIEGYTLNDGLELKTGKIYTVLELSNCDCCQCINVGLKTKGYTQCGTCGVAFGGIFHRASRFKPLEHETFADEVLESITKQIEEEIYVEY